MQKICIVIPCYNEAERLPVALFRENLNQNNYSFLFVNDGSTDGTLLLLEKLKTEFPERISVLNNTINQGKAESVRSGLIQAKGWKAFDVIGFLDADLATPLTEVDNITSHIDLELKFAFGSRVKRVGTNIKRKLHRHILGRIFATVASNLLGIAVYDTQCGAKFFHVSVIDPLFEKPFLTRWIFDIEIFFRYNSLIGTKDINSCAKEIPLNFWEDVGDSKLRLKHMITIPYDLFRLWRKM